MALNLSKIIWDQKTADIFYYLIDADVISFFVASKGKKFQAIDKNSQSRRSKNSSSERRMTKWISMKYSGKM